MTFASPAVLWLLVVVPAMAVFFWWSGRKRQALLTRFIQARLLPGLVAGVSAGRQKVRFALLILGVGCLIVAGARPQWGFTWDEVKQRGLDIVVAIDTSKSMLATDIAPNRLERAKLAALDLMQQAKSDRLGLVAFAGTAFLQCPLTIDDAAFRQSVESLDVSTLPQGGTALAAAIEAALTAFKEGDNFKVLVLLTDGEDQDSGALDAAAKAAKAGLQIFTIGIGTPEGELLRVAKPDGTTDFVRDEQGNVVKSHLNEDLLRQLAGASERGFYLPLRGAKTIDTLVEQGLAPLPKSEARERLVKRYHERYQWPLGLGILLLLGETFFPERKRERARGPLSRAGTSATLGKAAVLAVLVALPGLGVASPSPSRALREYKAGNYEQALKDYQGLLEKKKEDPRLHFNAGTAAYQAQQFEEALKQFNQALSSPDLKMQEMGYYNRGNTQYWLGEQSADPQKKSEAWQKSLQDFQSSLKLNPQDKDAQFNHEFVKKKLEELKQQQQQQQQNKDQNKDQEQQKQDQQQKQQSQQDQEKQDQQQQSQQQQGQEKQDQSGQKQDSQEQQQQQQQAGQQEKEQQKQAASQGQKQGQQPQPQPGQQGEDQKEKSGEEGQAYAAGQMTPEQAKQLLDAQKGEEKVLQFKPEGKPVDASRRFRDW